MATPSEVSFYSGNLGTKACLCLFAGAQHLVSSLKVTSHKNNGWALDEPPLNMTSNHIATSVHVRGLCQATQELALPYPPTPSVRLRLKRALGASETVQWVRVLAAKPYNPSSTPEPHMVGREPIPTSCLSTSTRVQRHRHTTN